MIFNRTQVIYIIQVKSKKNEGRRKIGIYFLKEIWDHCISSRDSSRETTQIEWKYLNGVFNTLGIGLEPTIEYVVGYSPSFSEFEDWIEQNGRYSQDMIDHFNSVILKEGDEDFTLEEEIFSKEDLKKWDEEGYVILKEAIPKEDCQKTVDFICDEIGIDLNDTNSWYANHPLKQGIMIQLFNHQILDKNRLSKVIRLAFEQLWRKKNLVVSMDRVSFNPPETLENQFEGPNLHWDVSLKRPIPYGIQGLLYLNDIEENQGAFTVIPGFHKIIHSWLDTIKTDPREINLLNHFDEKPIAGKAGDFIFWNHCLPHGSRPNHASYPRFVQYINYQPIDLKYQSEWI